MEFLFDNPLLIIIILALISAVFKRDGSREEKRRTVPPPFPFPEREPLDIPEPVMFPESEPEQGRRVREVSPSGDIFREERKNIEEKLAEFKKQEAELANKAERMKDAIAGKMREEERKKLDWDEKGFLDFDQKTLLSGIVFSEVLGPPRAKRPHRSVNIRRP